VGSFKGRYCTNIEGERPLIGATGNATKKEGSLEQRRGYFFSESIVRKVSERSPDGDKYRSGVVMRTKKNDKLQPGTWRVP